MELRASRPSYLSPTIGVDGAWASAGAHALRALLRQRSAPGVMALLKSMDARGMAQVLQEAGFEVSGSALARGREAVFSDVKRLLETALRLGVDGWAARGSRPGHEQGRRGDAGAVPSPKQTLTVANSSEVMLANAEGRSPLERVQAVLKGAAVRVVPLGEQAFQQRTSLQMIAAQALQKRVLGFGFEGVPGKFNVPASLSQVADLHREAASAVAVESTRASLVAWSSGRRVTGLNDWVLDSVQRLLHGSVNHDSAKLVVNSLNTGTVAQHARACGAHGIAELLAEQGLDADAPTIEQQAGVLGLQVRAPDRERGQYFGDVVGQDHRASLVKVNRSEALDLPHSASSNVRPQIGEQIRLNFKAGALTVSKAPRIGRNSPSV